MFSFSVRRDLIHHSRGGKDQDHELLAMLCAQSGGDYAQREKSAAFVPFCVVWTPTHIMLLPILRVGLPAFVKPLWKHLHTHTHTPKG